MAAKLLSIFLLFFLQRLAVAKDFSILGYAPEDLESEEKLAVLYAAWQQKHGKFNEDSKRFEIFKDNLKFIHEENQKNENYFLALNQFADLTHEEFKATRFGLHKERPNRLKSSSNFKYAGVKDIPDSVDWREKGAVVAVKDQGSCGSCWAFSTVAVVEGINAIVTGDLYSLSEQELIDCDKKEDDGCNGGLMDYAMEWIIENGGIDSEQDYPYKGVDGRCDANKKNAKLVTIDGYEDVPAYDEDALLKAVANQPVAVAIDGGSRSFQYYAGGVFTGTCSETELNHGVTVVGYGTEGGVGYWIVRNSWGPSWGEKGYVRMKRGAGLKAGLCGILTEPSYPVKNGANPPNPGPTPPAPTPPETVCDEYYTCQEDTTCCCLFPWNNLCFAWGCCPLKSATCCDDHYHCCPEDFPICNTSANTCLKGQNDLFGTRMMKRTPALPLKAAQSKKAARH